MFYFNDSTHLIHLRIPKHSLPIVKNVLGASPSKLYMDLMGLAGPKMSNSESQQSDWSDVEKFNQLWDRDSMRRVSHRPSVSICLGSNEKYQIKL